MYRRRNIKPVQQNEEKPIQVEKKVENKKEEPVIKAVTCPRQTGEEDELGKAPILNVLRNINYLSETGDGYHSVPFELAVDLLLSQGYLDVNFERYNKQSIDANAEKITENENEWHSIYRETTNYERGQFVAGDIIFTRDAHKTFAFIVTDVYSSGDEAKGERSSYLDYVSPLGERKNNPAPESRIMQTCTDCKGRCYMFAKEITLDNLTEHNLLSKFSTTGELRYLDPSNASVYDEDATVDSNWTCNRKVIPKQVKKPRFDTTFDGEPKTVDDLPTTSTKAQFNLKGITTVQGWLIYLKSTVALTKDSVLKDVKGSIIGDVVKTGVISIGVKGGTILSVDNVFDIPYPESSATEWSLSYRGNCTSLASEPLNSDEYQTNYGDTQGRKSYLVTESAIYSFMKYSPAP